MSTLPSFGYTPNQFTLHNASPEPIDLRWGGVAFTIPAVNVVGPKPALDFDGDPIPGTLLLADGIVPDKDGVIPPAGSPANWMAFEAIRNLLGIDPVTREAKGSSAKAGVSYLPNTPSKDLIAAVLADGKRRWEEHRVEWAQHTVAAYEARVASAKMLGVPAAPPDRDYAKAIQILKKNEATFKKTMEQAGDSDDEELQVLAIAKARAMEMAEKAAAGREIDKKKLAEELLQDPATRAHLMAQGYRIRKKGYLDVPAPEGTPLEE